MNRWNKYIIDLNLWPVYDTVQPMLKRFKYGTVDPQNENNAINIRYFLENGLWLLKYAGRPTLKNI